MQTVSTLIADEPAQQQTALTIAENLTKDDSVEIDDIAIVAQADGIEPLTAGGEGSDTVESLETGISVKAVATRSTSKTSRNRISSKVSKPSPRRR